MAKSQNGKTKNLASLFPKKIKIGSSFYRVRIDSELITKDDCFGTIDIREGTINLFPRENIGDVFQTLIHEIFHGIINKTRIKLPDEEKFVQIFSSDFAACLLDSPKLLEYMISIREILRELK